MDVIAVAAVTKMKLTMQPVNTNISPINSVRAVMKAVHNLYLIATP